MLLLSGCSSLGTHGVPLSNVTRVTADAAASELLTEFLWVMLLVSRDAAASELLTEFPSFFPLSCHGPARV
jgi:hypothetical protein